MSDRYERVRFLDGGRERSVRLRVTKMVGRFLVGVEVDEQGDEVVPGPRYDRRIRMIEKSAILRRRRLDFDDKYGVLVPSTRLTRRGRR